MKKIITSFCVVVMLVFAFGMVSYAAGNFQLTYTKADGTESTETFETFSNIISQVNIQTAKDEKFNVKLLDDTGCGWISSDDPNTFRLSKGIVEIDLNNYTLTTNYQYQVSGSSTSLTIKNGNIKHTDSTNYPFLARKGALVTTRDMSIVSEGNGLSANYSKTAGDGGHLTLYNTNITAKQGSALYSYCNNSEINVYGGNFVITGENSNGSVFKFQNASYVAIYGGTFTNTHKTPADFTALNNATTGNGKIKIYGGTYPVNVPESYIAEGYEVAANDDGTYTVVKKTTDVTNGANMTFDDWTSINTDRVEYGGVSDPSYPIALSDEGRNKTQCITAKFYVQNTKVRFKDVFSNLQVGEKYLITLWVKSVNNTGAALKLGIHTATGGNDAVVTLTTAKLTDDWVKIVGKFEVTEDLLNANKIGLITEEGAAGIVLIDDISLKQITTEGKSDVETDRTTYFSFDKWGFDKLYTTMSPDGSLGYEDVIFSYDQTIEDVGTALYVTRRGALSDRLKLMDLAKSPAIGNIYKYTAYLKLGENATVDNATIRVGPCDQNMQFTQNFKINKSSYTKVEFTATMENDDATGIGFDQPTGVDVITEFLIDDITVECIYRAPTTDYDITETSTGYSINAHVEDYYDAEGNTKTYQPIVAKYDENGLAAVKVGQKVTLSNTATYPLAQDVTLETDKLSEGEYIKVFSMTDVMDMYPMYSASAHNPFDPEYKKKTLYLLGDSIVTDYTGRDDDIRGWGMYIQEYFDEADVKVINNARGGESTKSYLYGPVNDLWKEIENGLEKGDYFMMSFGINDSSSSSAYRRCTKGEFKINIQKYIDKVTAKGAYVILLTCTPTIADTEDGYIKKGNHRREWAEAMIEVANNNKDNPNVYCFDLNQKMFDEMNNLIDNIGYDTFKTTYFAAGDNTHHNETGSRWILSMIMDLVANSDCSLKDYIKAE